jgi:hypothetical protein
VKSNPARVLEVSFLLRSFLDDLVDAIALHAVLAAEPGGVVLLAGVLLKLGLKKVNTKLSRRPGYDFFK